MRSRIAWDLLWLLVIGAASSVWCLTASRELGATFDEPPYILEGVKAWRTGSLKQLMTWGAMPLPIQVQTLPIYLVEWLRGEPFDIIGQLHEVLPLARLTTLAVFWWAVLILVYLWGWRLGGPWAARLALLGVATDPNILGHACLATTDIALLAMVLLSTFVFATGRSAGWWRRVFWPGVCYGLAMATKASAMPYVPLLNLLIALHAGTVEGFLTSLKPRTFWRETSRLRWDLAALMLIGFATVFAWCGSDWTTEPTFIAWAEQLPAGTAKSWLVPISHHLKIFPNAGEGLIQQIKHNMRGHGGVFLAGHWTPKAVWYYYPVALSIKLPDSTLVLLALTLLLNPRGFFRTPAGWAALVLLLFSFSTKVQIGVRLVFPCVVFTWLAMAVACSEAAPRWPRRGLTWLAIVALCYSATESLRVWPDGLRYANRFWGGPEQLHRWLTDSNLDWGQGLPELERWWADHGQPELHVWYYGIDPKILMHPFRVLLLNREQQPSLELLKSRVGTGVFAISLTIWNNCPDRRPETLKLLDELKQREPIGRTRCFFLYKFDEAR